MPLDTTPKSESKEKIMILRTAAVLVCLVATLVSSTAAERATNPIRVAEGASSCSGWKAICESRGPGCDAKFEACLKSGCWTEAAKYGGGRHCGLAKR